MEILKSAVILVIGFVLLIKGADYFVEGSSSVAKKFTFPAYSSETSSNTGANILHGPHHVAEKSMTATSLAVTSLNSFCEIFFTIIFSPSYHLL